MWKQCKCGRKIFNNTNTAIEVTCQCGLRVAVEPYDASVKAYANTARDLTRGPGTTLTKILSWFVTKPADCDCADRAYTMNAWGKTGCIDNFDTIINWLRESAEQNNKYFNEKVVRAVVMFAINISRQ